MAHSHTHDHENETQSLPKDAQSNERRQVLKRLQTASLLCLIFILVEVIGGCLAHSLAVLSDAAHLLADFASFGIAILAHHLADRPCSSSHTFGLQRTESLAALFSMLSLAILCVWLGVEAILRLIHLFGGDADNDNSPSPVDGRLMSAIAAIGVLVNLALAYVLGEHHVHLPGGGSHGGHEHVHDHDHADPLNEKSGLLNHAPPAIQHVNEVSPEPSTDPVREERNVNLQAAYLHVLGDLAQSVDVCVAGLVIWWKPRWMWIDPVCTLIFCLIVFYSTFGVIRSSLAILLQEVPPNVSWQTMYNDIRDIDGISEVHDLHIWSIAQNVPILSVHLHATMDLTKAMQSVEQVCRGHGIAHTTIQIQPADIDKCITCGDEYMHV